ncbi:hypothetical protein NPX13_g9557 [Xylaria arbuscula]|uniref:Uncharacterized protein n=1 Tax=Xylaria arbuscula TaxID=114810 RepID=A0A9W8N6L5_9PEZI|nr:hypothetical protein NPX13_g9557 [Xylaria arbuscula]
MHAFAVDGVWEASELRPYFRHIRPRLGSNTLRTQYILPAPTYYLIRKLVLEEELGMKSPRSRSSDQQQQHLADHVSSLSTQADPKLSQRKDEDGRLPIHWAASANQHPMVLLLSQQKSFDPDVEVKEKGPTTCKKGGHGLQKLPYADLRSQDDSGWTPLMIAASVKDGDAIVELLLSRGADVNQKNQNGQVCLPLSLYS